MVQSAGSGLPPMNGNGIMLPGAAPGAAAAGMSGRVPMGVHMGPGGEGPPIH